MAALWFRVQLERQADAARLQEAAQALGAQLAAEAGFPEAAEGHQRERRVGVVDRDAAGTGQLAAAFSARAWSPAGTSGASTCAFPSWFSENTSGQISQQRAWPSQRSSSTVTFMIVILQRVNVLDGVNSVRLG